MVRPEWANEFFLLRDELGKWVKDCMKRFEHAPWRGGHDEGNFTNPMCGYYMLTGDREVLDFLHMRRDRYLEWGKSNYDHGYYKDCNMDVAHGSENFYGFLTNLLAMDPDDRTSLNMLEDFIHHAGNWVEGLPAWYDWKNHCLTSEYLGTRSIKDYSPYNYCGSSDMAVFETAITAYLVTGKSMYIELARDWGDMWCGIVKKYGDALPSILVMTDRNEEDDGTEKNIVDEGRKGYGNWREASCGTFNYLLRLGLACDEHRYIDCARNILDRHVNWNRRFWDVIGDPKLLMWYYKYAAGDGHFDGILSQWAEKMPFGTLPEIMMMELEKREAFWFNYWNRVYAYRAPDGSIQEAGPRPVNLLAAYDLGQRAELLSQSMRMARHVMIPARVALRDGSDHGCSTLTYAHGAAQEVAFVLWTLAFGRMPYFRLRYYHGNNEPGLPGGVAAVTDAPGADGQSISFYNDNEAEETVTVKPSGGGKATFNLKPKSTTSVKVASGGKPGDSLLISMVHIIGG